MIVGMPNTGKSTLFNRLTASQARVGNWPGVTVAAQAARIAAGGATAEIVDLPGIYSLEGGCEAELIVRRFLEREPINLCLVLLHAAQLDRQLTLALQLKTLGLPLLVLLNMADEAAALGVRINAARLSAELELPVRLISAKYGGGVAAAWQCIESLLDERPGAARADGAGRHARAQSAHRNELHRVRQRAESLPRNGQTACLGCGACPMTWAAGATAGVPAAVAVERIYASAVKAPDDLPERLTARLDRLLLHRQLGLPLFFVTVFLLFELVYRLAAPMQEGMVWGLGRLRLELLEPALRAVPPLLRSFLLEGLYNGVGTVLSFLPVIVLFFVAMAAIEDSGYLARAAFLMDAVMARAGLDGGAFVIQVMGLGCNVPAILGTRVMRSRALRLLTMLVIPFSLCSARLQVFVFLAGALFSARAAPLVLLSLYAASFAAAALTAVVWQRRYRSPEPLLLEMPPYRLPTAGHLLRQARRAAEHFLRRAGGFIIGGMVAVWLLTHLPTGVPPAGPATLAGRAALLLVPVFRPVGIGPLLSLTLLLGFAAKEIIIGALAVIYRAGDAKLAGVLAADLGWVQAYSFMLFTLIYTPCLATVAAIRQESGTWRFTLFAVGWSLTLAWLASFLFYQGARALL